VVAANIPDGLIFGIVPTILGVVFAWGAWLTLLSTRTESSTIANRDDLAEVAKNTKEWKDDHEARLRALEGERR
jgi:hypothetical protein